jgi:hypothetical protein
MKKLLITLVLAIGVLGLTGCTVPSMDSVEDTLSDAAEAVTDTVAAVDPVTYNDSIVDIQTEALDAYNAYDVLVQDTPIGGDFDAVEVARVNTLKTIQDLSTKLSEKNGYMGDTDLRDAFVENLKSLTDSLEKEEEELIKLYVARASVEGDLPEEEVQKEKALLDAISARDDAAYKAIVESQEAFASKYNYELED